MLGRPNDLLQIRDFLARGLPVDRVFLERTATALSVPLEALLPYQGKSVREFVSSAVCGGVVFRIGGTSDPHLVDVPLPFQSGFAGILLAAEIVLDAAALRSSNPPTQTTVDLLRPLLGLAPGLVSKDRLNRCI